MNVMSLFAGVGGFDLAARWMGWESKVMVEWDEWNQKVLHKNFPDAEIYGDINKFDGTPYRGAIDLICGGFPCQPYSTAGKRKGNEDERHLWPQMLRVIREVQPRWVVGENVFGLLTWNAGMVFDQVQTDLEAEGYEVQSFVLPACGVNAPHKRDRVWIVAHAHNRRRSEQKSNTGREKKTRSADNATAFGEKWNASHAASPRLEKPRQANIEQLPTKNQGGIYNRPEQRNSGNGWRNWPTEFPLCGGNDGIPSELHTINHRHEMERFEFVQRLVADGRLSVDHSTGKIYSHVQRGKIGTKAQLLGSDMNGYTVHKLYAYGQKMMVRAHQIVWISLHGATPEGLMIDHINRNRKDNRLENLRLVNAKENAANRESQAGEKNPGSKITDEQRQEIREIYAQGNYTIYTLADLFGIGKSQVANIINDGCGMDSLKRIKAMGNAVVPQVVYQLFQAIQHIENTF